jgi:hypothetical protein
MSVGTNGTDAHGWYFADSIDLFEEQEISDQAVWTVRGTPQSGWAGQIAILSPGNQQL